MKKAVFFLFFPLALVLCSCTSRIGANEYSVSGTGQVNRALRGTIISVRQVNVESENGAGLSAVLLSAELPVMPLKGPYQNKWLMNMLSSLITEVWLPLRKEPTIC